MENACLFVLSIIVIAGMIPWRQAGVVESPFVVVFEQIGIPYAADIMNFVILIASPQWPTQACLHRRVSYMPWRTKDKPLNRSAK